MRPVRHLVLLLVAVLGASLTTGPPARAAVDIAPPLVGSCHWLTHAEAYADSEPKPPVDCSVHNTETIGVPRLPSWLSWNDERRLGRFAARRCSAALLAYFGGRAKAVQMSAYDIYWFMPTTQQRIAGARWLRCDLALLSPRKVPTLASEPTLGRLPLSDAAARCRKGKASGFAVVRCVEAHAFRATYAVKYPGKKYPGARRLVSWTIRKCQARMPRSAGFYEIPYRLEWAVGLRRSVCLKRTKR